VRLGVLGSTRGTNLAAIFAAIQDKQLNASVEIVISNKSDAFILERAASYQIPALFINPKDLTREQYDELISLELKKHRVDFIILIGYMRILSAAFVNQWPDKIINIHPSLLPLYAGKMDLDVHHAVLDAKEKETGCTVHYVEEVVDAGKILLQKRCVVLPEDTPESLKARVQALEGPALVEAIELLM